MPAEGPGCGVPAEPVDPVVRASLVLVVAVVPVEMRV
ncbi:hypothetical protein TM48_02955 [Mycobacterium shottsii]|nr:hypothetical protein TM48_02955 [Mycobacterium shottsii]